MPPQPVGVHREDEPISIEVQLSGPELVELMRVKLSSGLPFRFQARGWSMSPFIRDRDVITLEPLLGDTPRIGEIVAFIPLGSENPIVHRVVALRGEHFVARGDALAQDPDEIIPFIHLLGRVTRIERNGRPIWLGLGPERYLIAWLSRARLLAALRVLLVAWRDRIRGKR